MMERLKKFVKSILTYTFNFHNIVRFKQFGKNSYKAYGKHGVSVR